MDWIVTGRKGSQTSLGGDAAIEIAVPSNPLLHRLELLNLR
jgi:hypothetical protein